MRCYTSFKRKGELTLVTDKQKPVERCLSRAVTHVFFDRAIPPSELGDCASHLNESQHARDMLVLILSSQQQGLCATLENYLLWRFTSTFSFGGGGS